MPNSMAMVAVLLSVAALLGTGCHGGTCNEPMACPVVDQAPAADDVQYQFAGGTPVGLGYPGEQWSVQTLAGGEVAVSPGSCVDFDFCTITLKRLSFQLAEVSIDYSDGSVTVDNTVISFETPLTLTASGNGFRLPVGTTVHTCATVNGLPWHASAPLAGDQDVLTLRPSWDQGGGTAFDGIVPVVLRANDSACSSFTFSASLLAGSATSQGSN